MTPARVSFVLVYLLGIGTACSRQASVVDVSSERDAIRSLHEAWFAAEARRDIDASMSVLAPDIVFQPAGAPPVTGLEGARQLYRDFFALPYTSLAGTVAHVDVAASGELAYDVGTWNAVLQSAQGRVELSGKFLAVFRKANGQWKVVANSYSTNTP